MQHISLSLDASEDVLLLLFVCLDLANRFYLGVALSFYHLLFAESENFLLVSVLVLDCRLEGGDALIDVGFGVLPDFWELEER